MIETGLTYRKTIHPVKVQSKKAYRFALAIVFLFALLGLLAPMISSSVPLYSKCQETRLFPAFKETHRRIFIQDFSDQFCTSIKAPFHHSPSDLDRKALIQAPSRNHILGTDSLGRDVLSNLLFGMRTALLVVFGSLVLAFSFGLLYGLIAGFYGNQRLRYSIIDVFLGLLSLVLIVYFIKYACFLFSAHFYMAGVFMFLLSIAALCLFLIYLKRKNKSRTFSIPLDQIFMRSVDGFRAMPALVFILSAMYIVSSPSLVYLILVIAVLIWPTYARHARVETMRLRNEERIHAAILSGQSDLKIWYREFLPFVVRPLLVAAAFGCSSVIVLEATLSFIGIGIYHEHPSWGQLISAARDHLGAWWLWLFPGVLIMVLIWSFHEIGRFWEEKLTQTAGFRRT